MKSVLKAGWSLVALGVLVGLWNFTLSLNPAEPIASAAGIALMSGVTLVAAYAVWWMWFREG